MHLQMSSANIGVIFRGEGWGDEFRHGNMRHKNTKNGQCWLTSFENVTNDTQ